MLLADPITSHSETDYKQSCFNQLLDAFHRDPYPDLKYRLEGLDRLEKNLLNFRSQIASAIQLDFNKSSFESDTSEFLTCLLELRIARKQLNHWLKYIPVKTPTELIGSSHVIRYEPKGVVLIMSPWNYPVNLVFIPLIAAWAAGNKIILKPSEFVPNTNRVLKSLIHETFSPEEVQFIEGDSNTAHELLQLPFNHIFFTGSQKTARKILQAASQHLSSVTLELGGKNPLILDKSVSLKDYMPDIVYGKCINAGQTCISPDYILLPVERVDSFIQEWKACVEKMYGEDPTQNPDYCGIIHDKHFERLQEIIQGSLDQGAQLTEPLQFNRLNRKLKPVLLKHSDLHHESMQEELFGPILPLIGYSNLEEVLSILQKKERPLTLYIFSHDKKIQTKIMNTIKSGGVTINNCLLNYCNFNLPFGGDQHSGQGANHGFHGFETFSHKRSISTQGDWLNTLRLFYPPFTGFKNRINIWLLKLIGRI